MEIERAIVRKLAPKCDIFAFFQPGDMGRAYARRVMVPDTHWQTLFEVAVAEAKFILVHVADFTKGLLWELDSIRAAQMQDKVIAVVRDSLLADGRSERVLEGLRWVAQREVMRLAAGALMKRLNDQRRSRGCALSGSRF